MLPPAAAGPVGPASDLWQRLGLYYARAGEQWMLSVPWWTITGLVGALTAFWTRRAWLCVRHRRRIHNGLCTCCGYDLRATGLICSECGTPRPSQAERRRDVGVEALSAIQSQPMMLMP